LLSILRSAYARYGDGDADKGFALDFLHKQIDGSRDKYEHKVTDARCPDGSRSPIPSACS
jgi:hypothetical protein